MIRLRLPSVGAAEEAQTIAAGGDAAKKQSHAKDHCAATYGIPSQCPSDIE